MVAVSGEGSPHSPPSARPRKQVSSLALDALDRRFVSPMEAHDAVQQSLPSSSRSHKDHRHRPGDTTPRRRLSAVAKDLGVAAVPPLARVMVMGGEEDSCRAKEALEALQGPGSSPMAEGLMYHPHDSGPVPDVDGPGSSGGTDRINLPPFVMRIFKNYAAHYNRSSAIVKRERDAVHRVLREHRDGWKLLRHADTVLRDGRDPFVITLRPLSAEKDTQNSSTLHAASAALREDRELLITAFRGPGGQGWRALGGAPAELRKDRGVVQEAIRQGGPSALSAASASLREDSNLMYEALAVQHRQVEAAIRNSLCPSWSTFLSECMVDVSYEQILGMLDELQSEALAQCDISCVAKWILEDVQAGVCGLRHSKDGTLTRVVPITRLRLYRHDGFMLVQLGTVSPDRSSYVPGCQLPGHKILTSLLPSDGLKQFLEKRFSWPFVEAVKKGLREASGEDGVGEPAVQKLESCVSTTFPQNFLSTTYVCAEYSSSLPQGFDWDRYFTEVPVDQELLKRKGCSDKRCLKSSRGSLTKRFNSIRVSAHTAPQIFVCKAHQDEIYAWLPSWEFEWVQKSDIGKDALKTWLSNLTLSQVSSAVDESSVDTRRSLTGDESDRV